MTKLFILSCWLSSLLYVYGKHSSINQRPCSFESALNVQNDWNTFWAATSTEGKLSLMRAVIEDFSNRETASANKYLGNDHNEPLSETDTNLRSMRFLSHFNNVIHLLNEPATLHYELEHLLLTDEEVGGLRSELLSGIFRSFLAVLPRVISGMDLLVWHNCIIGAESHMAAGLHQLVGNHMHNGAVCEMDGTYGVESNTIRGHVFFKQPKAGGDTRIRVYLSGLDHTDDVTSHGLHIHEYGTLDDACTAAGPHYNPEGRLHGAPTDVERHVADLGNILEGAHGRVDTTISDHKVQLTGDHSVIGRSIVVHVREDDLGQGGFPDSTTTGHAGSRIACCTIRSVTLPEYAKQQYIDKTRSPGVHAAKQWHWEYFGAHSPSHWEEAFPQCSGSRQSPINIDSTTAVASSANDALTPISYTGYDQEDSGMVLLNNGHTAKLVLENPYSISDGGLPGVYQALQIHWHWGAENERGSEHTLNGQSYPLEMHIVHKLIPSQDKDSTVSPDYLAVLGYFFEIQEEDNPDWLPITQALQYIHEPGSQVHLPPITLGSLLPGDATNYYRYLGSLTTPPCSEVVVWTVLKKTIKISAAQLEEFRQLRDDHYHNLVDNFRPLQEVKARAVFSF